MDVQAQKVTDSPNHNTLFMVWQFKKDKKIKSAFEAICALVTNLNKSAAVRFPAAKVSCVMGIGAEAWETLELPKPLPKELETFQPIEGRKHTAVATPGDLHFHVRADGMSICYDMAFEISKILLPVAESIVEVHGFRYWDGRSILGFVDGTENPEGSERDFFAKVGKEDAKYQGGSYLFVQKYLHNMKAWNDLPIEEQEKVIGRYKSSDIEMSDEVKPKNAHSALTSISTEDGQDLKVVRDNMPFGHPSQKEVGTYFIAYASTFSTVKKMLNNMFIGDPVGNYDRILDYSKAVTGSLYFVPTLDMLDEFSG